MLFAALLLLSSRSSAAVVPGPTFGNGLASVPICGSSRPPVVVASYSLQHGETQGVMHHFWVTGARSKIDRIHVEYYVDGESVPSVSFQPAMMCGMGFPSRIAKDFEYSAGGMCGKTAPVGGWWNTFPVPFYKSIRVTVRADESDGPGCFGGYVNIRGTPNLPLVLPGSGLPLPFGTTLSVQFNPLALRQPLEYITLASLPAGKRGLIFQTAWAVEARPDGGAKNGGGYIEGCWQFYRQANESFPGLVVGTGVEDYFDSGYYFGADSGDPLGILFQNALSGLTHFARNSDGSERLSAYRFHTADPLVMSDGGKLNWRVGAQFGGGTTKCGNPLPAQAASGSGSEDDAAMWAELEAELEAEKPEVQTHRVLSAVNVTTSAWVYTFP